MLFSDRKSLYLAAFTVMCFIFFCLLDVTGTSSLMENIAIRMIIIALFLLIVLNVILSIGKKDDKKNLPNPEDTSKYRQM